MMSKFTRSALALAVLALVPGAWATTVTGTFQVTATLIPSCNISGSTLNFGSAIDPIAAAVPLDATSTLTVQCTNTTSYAVSLNAGVNAGGATNFTSRAVKSGANTIGYQLYTDIGRTTVWGDGISSTSTRAGTGSGSTQTLTVYGRLPSLTNAVPGAYTDTVTVTITY